PVVLGGQPNTLAVGDGPHDRWVDRAADVHVQLGEAEVHRDAVENGPSLLSRGWNILPARWPVPGRGYNCCDDDFADGLMAEPVFRWGERTYVMAILNVT